MEANCENNQFEESITPELQADGCKSCDGLEPDGDMRPGMRPGNNRPCGNGCGGLRPGSDRPGMRPGQNRPCGNGCGNTRPGNGRPGMRPGGRPGMRPDHSRPCGSCSGDMWPGNARPYGNMRSNGVMDDMDLHSDWNCGNRMVQDSRGQSMEIECVCQNMKGCHMQDPMDRLGDAFPPVMAFVPWQQWGDLYDPECGLKQGTIFKDLNYIFCGTRC